MVNQVIVLPHDQPIHHPTGIDAGVMPAVAGLEGTMGQIVKEKSQGYSHHQGRCEPAIKDKGQEIEMHRRQDNAEENGPGNAPFQQFVAAPQATAEEENLVIKEAGGNQPEGTEGGNNVIRIMLGIVDMGMVLQVHPGEHRKAEAQQQGRPMAHHRIPEAVGMGGVVAGIVDNSAL